jgi:hypothetical protein
MIVQVSAADAACAKDVASEKLAIMARGELMVQARCGWF